MDFDRLTTVMRQLALEAGDKIMQIYGAEDFEVRSKSDASPVTEADEAADALISAGLRAEFPDVTLVTEEQAATHGQQASTFLIVDPLDGTKEFVQRRGDFTVNIAYVEDGVPLRGVVYAPAKGRVDIWMASLGQTTVSGLSTRVSCLIWIATSALSTAAMTAIRLPSSKLCAPGRTITSTPMKPTITAAQRRKRTFSPSHSTAAMVTNKGVE